MSIRKTWLVTLFSRPAEFKQFQSLFWCTTSDGCCMQACYCDFSKKHHVTMFSCLQAASALNHEQQFGEEPLPFLLRHNACDQSLAITLVSVLGCYPDTQHGTEVRTTLGIDHSAVGSSSSCSVLLLVPRSQPVQLYSVFVELFWFCEIM
jgi:hypothetical protein